MPVVSKKVAIVDTAYTLLTDGVSNVTLQMQEGNGMRLIVATAEPAADAVGYLLIPVNLIFTVTGVNAADNLYARTLYGKGSVAVNEGLTAT